MFNSCFQLSDYKSPKNVKFDPYFATSPLTRESALSVLNNLYDFTVNPEKLNAANYYRVITFSRTTKELLTTEDLKIATDKGWTIAS